MRIFGLVAAFGLATITVEAQVAPPAPDSGRIEVGPILGIASSGTATSWHGGASSTGNRGTVPYVGVFMRGRLTRSVHTELQAVYTVIADDGADFSMPFLQLPLVLEILPFSPRRATRYVRPVFMLGGSAGLRLSPNGGTAYWGQIRPVELSAMFGLGVEVHLSSADWIQLLGQVKAGLTDLSASPGRTTSNLLIATVKFHPASRR